MDRKERLIEVFNDTQRYMRENAVLAAAVEKSKAAAKLYGAEDYPELPEMKKAGTVAVTKSRTFEAAMRLHAEHPGAKVAVLNFASATRPGGGVKSGSSAQEEALCRCSTLYPTLDQRRFWKQFYDPNLAANDPLHTDVCLYSPGVVICMTDESFPKRLPEAEFVTVDVITCAAPNLREKTSNYHNPDADHSVKITKKELYDLHLQRAKHILHVAAANGVDCLVLGAFGCGAFENDPNVVARAYAAAIEAYRSRFEVIEFAIYCRVSETQNYDAFKAWCK